MEAITQATDTAPHAAHRAHSACAEDGVRAEDDAVEAEGAREQPVRSEQTVQERDGHDGAVGQEEAGAAEVAEEAEVAAKRADLSTERETVTAERIEPASHLTIGTASPVAAVASEAAASAAATTAHVPERGTEKHETIAAGQAPSPQAAGPTGITEADSGVQAEPTPGPNVSPDGSLESERLRHTGEPQTAVRVPAPTRLPPPAPPLPPALPLSGRSAATAPGSLTRAPLPTPPPLPAPLPSRAPVNASSAGGSKPAAVRALWLCVSRDH